MALFEKALGVGVLTLLAITILIDVVKFIRTLFNKKGFKFDLQKLIKGIKEATLFLLGGAVVAAIVLGFSFLIGLVVLAITGNL